MSDKNRILWIDYVKAFAIITVVMLHIPIGDPYRHIARSFVIPVFFFLSGIFSHPSRYATFGSFFRHKTIRLLLPYVIFNVLNYLYWLLIARHYGADADMDMSVTKPLLGILSGIEPWMYHYKPLWFLPCLMVAETLFWCTYRLSCSMDKAMVLPVCMVVLSGTGYAYGSHPTLRVAKSADSRDTCIREYIRQPALCFSCHGAGWYSPHCYGGIAMQTAYPAPAAIHRYAYAAHTRLSPDHCRLGERGYYFCIGFAARYI